MITSLIGWIDKEIERYLLTPLFPFIAMFGVLLAKLTDWHPLAVVVGGLWAMTWIALHFWRLLVWAQKDAAKQRRREKRRVRDAKAAAKKPKP